MNRVKDNVEKMAFGACSYLGEKIGISPARVRMYFIYTSFVAMGSPIIFYLIVVFWMNIKRYVRNARQNPIWN